MKYAPILFTLFLILCGFQGLGSQNLVDNSGFETHLRPLVRLQHATFLENFEFAQVVKSWKSQGYAAHSSLFSTRYRPEKWQEELGYNFRICRPHSGHSMLLISAFPVDDRADCGRGSSGYVQTLLTAPVQPGRIYTVGFWIFLPRADANRNCPDFTRHIGIALSKQEIKLKNPDCMLINNSPLLVDTVKTQEWHRVAYRIAPVDTLSYLLIGSFYNPAAPFVVKEGVGCEFRFFIDDVEVAESSETGAALPYPSAEPADMEVENDAQTSYFIYFDSNADTLTAIAKATLDSIIALARLDVQSVFEINGHTDIRGTGNKALSEKRAFQVKTYLEQQGKLPNVRLETYAYGSDKPVADNSTEAGRRLNRRVEVRISKKKLPFVLYRLASQTADADSAFRLLRHWLTFPGTDGLLLLHDPDLNRLHSHPRWVRLTDQVKAAYKKFKNPALAFELDNLYFKDQRYRSLGNVYMDAKGNIPFPLDSIPVDSRIAHIADSLNAEEAMRFLEKYGWVDPALVGSRAALAPFYPVQHSGDLSKMKKVLATLPAACEKNYVPWRLYALMYDRAQLMETGTQHFGTQFQADEKDPSLYRLAPLDDAANIDAIREKVGLGPLDTTSSYRVLLKNK